MGAVGSTMSLHDVPPDASEGMLLAGASPEAAFVRVNQNSLGTEYTMTPMQVRPIATSRRRPPSRPGLEAP